MAVFTKSSKKSAPEVDSNSRNHIAYGATVRGEIEATGVIRIDGKVQGTIYCKGKVVIGEQGEVIGDIKCQEAEIEGKHTGNTESLGLLHLKASATVIGDITVKARMLSIDAGALHSGKTTMKDAVSNGQPQSGSKLNGQTAKQNGKREAVAAN